MQNRKLLEGGFVGLLMLLLGVALISFLIVRTDLFTGEKGGKNMIDQGQDAIQKAKDAKNLLEHNAGANVKEGTYCFGRLQEATPDAPYRVEEHVKINIDGMKITGSKTGTQAGPDMNNGYEGTLVGTKDGTALELLFSYTIEGSAQKEKEFYDFSPSTLTKKRYVLKEENKILVPDTTTTPTLQNYGVESCK